MTHEDLPHVLALQYSCYHPDFHEPLSAFESKLSASPDTCWVISAGPAAIQAYLVCLPIADENYPLLHAPDWQAQTDPAQRTPARLEQALEEVRRAYNSRAF